MQYARRCSPNTIGTVIVKVDSARPAAAHPFLAMENTRIGQDPQWNENNFCYLTRLQLQRSQTPGEKCNDRYNQIIAHNRKHRLKNTQYFRPERVQANLLSCLAQGCHNW